MNDKLEAIDEWYRAVPRSITVPAIGGLAASLVIFGAFGTWAATAPLAAAVTAPGTFVATGQNKYVQHLEGGIIAEILVAEGDEVEAGQTLITLDETAARANYRRLKLRIAEFKARAARLETAMAGKREIDFSGIFVTMEDRAEIERTKAAQQALLDASLVQLDGDILVIGKNRESLELRVQGTEAQKAAVERQRELISQELAGKRTLFEQGFYRRSDLFTIERAAAEAEGSLGKLESEIGDMRSQIARLAGQIEQVRQEHRRKAGEELQTVSTELQDLQEQILTAGSVLGRTEVTAPVSGTLIKLHYHTPGGVIESGKQIAEILPADAALVIESLIRPTDIDNVHLGQTASVRLTSFSQRTTPELNGTVAYVSADTIEDPRPGSTGDIYLARIIVKDQQLKRIDGLEVTPGMPADVFIETAHRTFLDYLTKPIRDSMGRAFLEE